MGAKERIERRVEQSFGKSWRDSDHNDGSDSICVWGQSPSPPREVEKKRKMKKRDSKARQRRRSVSSSSSSESDSSSWSESSSSESSSSESSSSSSKSSSSGSKRPTRKRGGRSNRNNYESDEGSGSSSCSNSCSSTRSDKSSEIKRKRDINLPICTQEESKNKKDNLSKLEMIKGSDKGDCEVEDTEVNLLGKMNSPTIKNQSPIDQSEIANNDDLREARDFKKAVQGEGNEDSDDDDIGPMPLPKSDPNSSSATSKAQSKAYGGALLPGEGEALAQYVQQNLRIPRRGEIGYGADEISNYETSGYVMSGSRHARMNAIRIRKENQVYSAEEQRALALITLEENQQKEAALLNDFKTMLKENHSKLDYDDVNIEKNDE